jgi:mono/diheme cytochrome c family protein
MSDANEQYGKVVAAGAIVLLLVSGCGKPAYLGARDGEFPLAEKAVRPEDVKDFQTLFDTNCRGCHGANGLGGAAPPLNDPLFLAIIPEAELRTVIGGGRKGTLMPAFARAHGGTLTDEQVEILVKNLHDPVEWTKAKPDKQVPDYLLADALAHGVKKGDIEEGAGVYEMNCVSCHGKQGMGGDAGPLNDPAFLALTSNQLLRRIAITGRHDFGMPAYNEKRDHGKFTPMTNQDITDLVAYLATWRKGGGH